MKAHKDTEGRSLFEYEADTGATLPQTKEHQEPPGRNQGRFFPRHCRDGGPATL